MTNFLEALALKRWRNKDGTLLEDGGQKENCKVLIGWPSYRWIKESFQEVEKISWNWKHVLESGKKLKKNIKYQLKL